MSSTFRISPYKRTYRNRILKNSSNGRDNNVISDKNLLIHDFWSIVNKLSIGQWMNYYKVPAEWCYLLVFCIPSKTTYGLV